MKFGIPRRRTASTERGAAIVEFAVVLPVLLSLVMGMIDMGLILHSQQELQAATRTTARSAVVGALGDPGCVPAAAVPSGVNADTAQLVCSVKQLHGDDVRVKLGFSEFKEGQRLTLCSMSPTTSLTGVLDVIVGGGATKAKQEMRIENTDYAVFESFEESPLVGHDWDWCP